jgi:hypothetical protein
MRAILGAALLALASRASAGSCSFLNDCSGQGVCDTVNSRCVCYDGWGSAADISLYKAPDCSARAFGGRRAGRGTRGARARARAIARLRFWCGRSRTPPPSPRRHVPV